MSAFKKFCDFCGGIALFVGALFLFREFMSFSPEQIVTLREKWTLFLSESEQDVRPYLGLVGLLALSLLVGILCRRLPFVGFAVATLPFLQALSMLRDGYLYERPMLYLLFGALPIIGNLFDALHRDSLDGRHRAFVLGNVSSLLSLGFCLLILWRISVLKDAVELDELRRFDQTLLSAAEENLSHLRQLAALYGVGIAVSLAFCGAYWLDVILAALPLIWALPRQIMGTLGPHSELLLSLMILCLCCRLALMAAGTPWGKKKATTNQ